MVMVVVNNGAIKIIIPYGVRTTVLHLWREVLLTLILKEIQGLYFLRCFSHEWLVLRLSVFKIDNWVF